MQRYNFLFLLLSLCSTAVSAQHVTASVKDSIGGKSLLLPKNHYVQHLGFFCKTELRVQKFTSLNLFFRLGSKAYVDYLERKSYARAPHSYFVR